jgi:hypothetical protein
MPLPEAVGDWVRQEAPISYDRETIFDYINGAGEVYRSYAFDHVLVGRYEGAGGRGLTVELFDMGTEEDAFGVFSYAREEEEEGIGGGFERKGSILCFWQSRFYVCVAAEQREPDPGPDLEEVARGISETLPPSGEPPSLLGALPAEGLVPFSDRFFHLHQSLNYHYYLVRENILNLSPDTDAVLARYQPGPTYLLLVEYGSEADAVQALDSFRAAVTPAASGTETTASVDGTFVSSDQAGRHLVLVLEAPSRETASGILEAALTKLGRTQQ